MLAKKTSPAATVLVVDDEVSILDYLRTVLEMDCYKVETACGGREAVRRLNEGVAPDVVLLDVNMPGMDGLETLRELLRVRPGLRVIMCSGAPDPRKALTAFLIGARDFLTKPFRNLYLSAALDRCLYSSANADAVPWNVVRDIWEVAPEA